MKLINFRLLFWRVNGGYWTQMYKKWRTKRRKRKKKAARGLIIYTYVRLRRINLWTRGLRRRRLMDAKEMSSFHRPTTYSSTAGDRKKPLFLISYTWGSHHSSRWILTKIRSASARCCAPNYKLHTTYTHK